MVTKDTDSGASGCPDFDLGPLVKFSPAVLVKDESPADAFVLALALAFNDMKGIQWTIVQLDKCRPTPGRLDAEAGQWEGMRLQMGRLNLLVLHELLKAIETAAKSLVLEHMDFQTALKLVNNRYRHDWAELVALANNKGDPTIRQYVARARNNLAAHYYDPKLLARGYRECFFEQPTSDFNRWAYASFGNRVEATRFYFADAAVQRGQHLLDPAGKPMKRVRRYTLRMLQALRFLIEAYLTMKEQRLTSAAGRRNG